MAIIQANWSLYIKIAQRFDSSEASSVRAALFTSTQVNRVRITDHAGEEAEEDHLTFDEIYFSALHGEIIEDYPTSKPYPSCLIYGQTFGGDPVHSVWAYNASNQWAALITVYRPDPNMWINWRERRKQ